MDDKSDLSGEAEAGPVAQPGLRYLEVAVYIMGGLLVLMVLGLIGGIIWKVTHKGEALPPATQLLDLGLPAGTTVHSMQFNGDRLALDVGDEVIVIDTRRNAVTNRIALGAK